MHKIFLSLLFIAFVCTSCVSTKNTIKNIDSNAPIPKLTKENAFVLTKYSSDKKYGYDKDYPINVFYKNTQDENLNAIRFLNALAGPNGEKVTFEKIESCCPFPTTQSELGAGFLDVYKVNIIGRKKFETLYFNIYERGALEVPVGFSIKNP